MGQNMERRQLLLGGAAAGAAGIAGCVGAAALGGWFRRDESLREPVITSDVLDEGWELVEATEDEVFEQEIGPVTVTVRESRVMYENVALREDVREKTLESVDSQLTMAFVTAIELSPALDQTPAGIGRGDLMDEISQTAQIEFENELIANGLDDVERVRTDEWDTFAGHRARLFEYGASFPVEPISFDVAGETSVEIDGTDLDVAGWLSVWHDGTFAYIAGGAHPDENFSTEQDEELSELIDLSLGIDLELDPDTYREDLHDIMRSVE